ncbi:MAG: glycosyltransferase [Saccharofermentans sp.]|jgi:glycosyltransferase involved in cell wall biosynthesis|nr:glycosyltransferase [Saccharofermentans sp.]
MKDTVLYIVVPVYKDADVIKVTCPMFLDQLFKMRDEGLVSDKSRVLFVDDGSGDDSWDTIKELSEQNKPYVKGIALSRNRGHQNAVTAGLMEAKDHCDVTITIDDDGQDDIGAMTQMMKEYDNGCEIVYGVRQNRDTDSFMKRFTAQTYYKTLNVLGADVIYNHADYRLVSAKALQEFANFKEVNLFLRGLFPMVGFKSTCVYYDRHERMAGKGHYSISKLFTLAFDGVTSLSVKPIKIITWFGFFVALVSFILLIYTIITHFVTDTPHGWASTSCIICFLSGMQMMSIGVIGEYIGKIYLETKQRPRYIISDRCDGEDQKN